MRKRGILNHELAATIATLGHTDSLVVADAGLPIPPESRPAVVASFRQIAAMADLIMSFPIDYDIDPAVVFRP